MNDFKRLNELTKEQKSKLNAIYKNLDDKIIADALKICALAGTPSQKLALARRIIDLKVDPLQNELKKLNFIAVLYGISDIGNIGAIARSAYALGCEGLVIVTKSVNMQGVLRSSSGAAYEIPIAIFEDGLSLLNELKQCGFRLYATASEGKNIKEMKFAGKRALVMGSEGEGIPQKALAKCDECVGIKLKDGWDSLNVSAAFAIICDRMIDE